MAEDHGADAGHESPSSEHKEEKSKESFLESIVKDVSGMVKNTLKVAAVAAMPFLYAPFIPAQMPLAATTTYAYAASKATNNIIQKKDPLEGIVRNGLNGAIISYPLAEGFKAMNSLEARMMPEYGTFISKAAKGALMAFGLQPAVVAGNNALNYGFGKRFRETTWKNIKRAAKLIAIPGVLNVTYLYQFGLFTQMAVSGAMSYLLNLSHGSDGKGEFKNLYKVLNPFPYVGAVGTSAAKAVKTIGTGVYGSKGVFYNLGSGIRSTLDKYLGPGSATSSAGAGNPAPAANHT